MKNRVILVFLAIVLVVSLAAFAACAAEEEVVEEGVWQWPEKLVIGASRTTGNLYMTAIGWQKLFSDDTGVTTRIAIHPVMTTRWVWLRNGEIDLTSLKQSGKPWLEGQRENATRDAGPWHVRGWWITGQRDRGFTTYKGSPIKTPEDIEPGTRITYSAYLGPPEAGEYNRGLVAWAGLTMDDVVWIPAASKAAIKRLLMDGKADVSYVESVVESGWYEAAASPRGLAFLDLDPKANPEGAARYKEHDIDTIWGVIASGVTEGIGHHGMTVIGRGVISSAQDPEFIYRWVKWMHQNYDRYKDAHVLLRGFTVENVVNETEVGYIPYHDGTIRYLQELGVWTEKAEENAQYWDEIISEYIARYQAAIDDADSKGIEVTPENKEWIDLWFSYRAGLPEFVSRHPGVEPRIFTD